MELKYLTRAWTGLVDGERYELKSQGAQDIRAYDVAKDIYRVERFIAGGDGTNGAVVVLTNYPSYWRPPKQNDVSNAAAFRLSEGGILAGLRAWGPKTGPGTVKGQEAPLELWGYYGTRWRSYSKLAGTTGIEFRQLVVPIGSVPSGVLSTSDDH